MRGHDEQTAHLFSYLSPEQRVPANHPLQAIRQMTDRVLATLSPMFMRMYSNIGRPSIARKSCSVRCCSRCCTRSTASGC